MGFGLKSKPLIFSWSIWAANPPSTVCDNVKEHWPNLRNIMTSRYELRMNNVYQVDLQPFRKNRILCTKGLWINFYFNFSIFVPFFTHVQPNPRTPHRGFWHSFRQMPCLDWWKVQPRYHANVSIYMLLFLQFELLFVLHQPLASTPYKV